MDSAGVGLRMPHVNELLNRPDEIPWVELLLDNWLCNSGVTRKLLLEIVERFPVALHGVGLSIGSSRALDTHYLGRIKELVSVTDALVYSEHISFSWVGERFIPDLMPLSYTQESVTHLVERIDFVQNFLGQEMLIENISSYLQHDTDTLSEAEFINELVQRSGCGLLLDVNNLYINQENLKRDAWQALDTLPLEAVRQIHLGGFEPKENYLLDAHNHQVDSKVWELYVEVIKRTGPVATLIEWDNDLPDLNGLLAEQKTAQAVLDSHQDKAA